MKQAKFWQGHLSEKLSDVVELIAEQWKRNPFPLQLFLLLCSNLIFAPAIYAATGDEVTRNAAYALGLLGLVTLGLSIYLFVVIFQPERF